MTLGYSMQFCSTCERETNHRIREQNGKLKKECVACSHATGSQCSEGTGIFRRLAIPGRKPLMSTAAAQSPS